MLEQGQLQRRSVKGALRATFSGRQGVGYIPLPFERLRGAFLCVSCPSRHRGAQFTADCPQHVPDPVDVVRTVWSAARGEGRSHWLWAARAHIGAQTLGCVFANGGNANETRDAILFFRALRTGLREVRSLEEYGKGYTKKYVVHVRILCYE
jgi:hypothetical protein